MEAAAELKPGKLPWKYTRWAKGPGENISGYRPTRIRSTHENGYAEKYSKKESSEREKYDFHVGLTFQQLI